MTAGLPLVLAIDLGSSSIKVAAVDARLGVRSVGTAAHPIETDVHGRREHRPARTWAATLRAARRALAALDPASRVDAIALTGPRGSFLLADAAGRPIGNAVSWQDRRAASLAASFTPAEARELRLITGTTFDPSVVLPKLLWLREQPSTSARQPAQIGTPQSDVLRRLGARESVVDLSVAGHFGLLDVRSLDWSPTLLARYGVDAEMLPRLVAPGAVVGALNARVARLLGVRAGLPIVAAGSDGVCSELGAGVVGPGQRYAYLGTASAVAGPVATADPAADATVFVMPGSAPSVWRRVALGMAGASARTWFMRIVGIRDELRFDRLVATSPPGANGVAFIPTLAGATAPVPSPTARGAFVGLSLGSDRADAARAVLEGVALEVAFLDRALGIDHDTSPIRLTGGGSRSSAWAQIIADVVGRPIDRVIDPNPGLRGAAAYAWAALDAGRSAVDIVRSHAPACEALTPTAGVGAIHSRSMETYATLRREFLERGLDDRIAALVSPRDVPSSSA